MGPATGAVFPTGNYSRPDLGAAITDPADGRAVAYGPLTDRFHAGSVGSGEYAVRGTWDATTRTLRIAPDPSARGPGRAAVSFTALYDSGYRAFAGLTGAASRGAGAVRGAIRSWMEGARQRMAACSR
jgi:hypothetical protein